MAEERIELVPEEVRREQLRGEMRDQLARYTGLFGDILGPGYFHRPNVDEIALLKKN